MCWHCKQERWCKGFNASYSYITVPTYYGTLVGHDIDGNFSVVAFFIA